jgi:hypothetical protein
MTTVDVSRPGNVFPLSACFYVILSLIKTLPLHSAISVGEMLIVIVKVASVGRWESLPLSAD